MFKKMFGSLLKVFVGGEKMVGHGRTDQGAVRSNNEDSIYVENGTIGALDNLYIVSDGMGGHNAGEVASSKAIEFFNSFIKSADFSCYNGDYEAFLSDAVKNANSSVNAISKGDPTLLGMGATFTALTFVEKRAIIAHLGDSRVYSKNGTGVLKQLTIDHTYVNELVNSGVITAEQAKTHHLRNIITRALGTDSKCDVDTYTIDMTDEVAFLMCSDGLNTMLDDDEINNILEKEYKNNVETMATAVDALIETSNKKGGHDNISVIMIMEGGI